MTHVFRPGDTFLGYTIERLLGEGGLGSVWLARHGMLDALRLEYVAQNAGVVIHSKVERIWTRSSMCRRIPHEAVRLAREIAHLGIKQRVVSCKPRKKDEPRRRIGFKENIKP